MCAHTRQRVFSSFLSEHEDFVHDLAYDFYGKRLATCSSDQRVKVFDQDDTTGEWTVVAEIKVGAHNTQIA